MYKFSQLALPRASRITLVAAALATTLIAPGALAADPPAAAPKPAADAKPEAEKPEAEKPETAESAGPAAPTKEEQEEAKVAFEAGTKAFGEGAFALAVTEFTKASAKVPSPHAEYWIARSMDSADPEHKNPAEVVAAYSKFLSNPGAQHAGAERVAESQARLVELKKLLPASVKLVTVPSGASVTIDGKLQEGKTPLETELAAGAHQLQINLEGHEPTVVEMDVQGGSAVEQEITLKPEAPVAVAVVAAPAAAAPAEEKSIVPAAVTLGLAGAGLISGTLFGIMALGAKSDFEEDPTVENADAAERNALIADMSFGIAITLGITGIVLLTADEEEKTETARSKRITVAPYASKKGGGLAGQFTF